MRFALSILLAAASCSFGATYYVDPDGGSDAAAGTSQGAAWRTIPGTRTTDGSGYLNVAWGSVTTSARIGENTTIKVKSGTTHSSADGGYIWMTGAGYYETGCSNIVIEKDTTWSSGDTVFDGNGMTIGIGLFLVQTDGITLRGFTVQHSDLSGVYFKEKAGTGAPLTNIAGYDLYLYDNGKTYLTDPSGAGDGQINIRYAWNVTFSNCVMNGNQRFTQGFTCGDSAKGLLGINRIISCVVTNQQGTPPPGTDDTGIGFKALNSTVTFSNCVSAWNLKGWDCGEAGGTWGFTNKIISCTASNNYWAMNANGAGSPYPVGSIGFYFINNRVVSNAFKGIHIYAPPYSAAVVHCLFDNNGQAGGPYDGSQLSITPETITDTNVATAYSYNNIFQNSYINVLENNISHPTNRFTWLSDYNSYKQNSTERFCLWSLSYGPTQVFFDFGADGPGHASGNWYDWYLQNATPPLYGTGHFHSDSHSKGTGCDDTSLPGLSGYQLTNSFPMRNLSLESWYVSEMGMDISGQPRTSWDVGPMEAAPLTTANSTIAPGVRKGKKR